MKHLKNTYPSLQGFDLQALQFNSDVELIAYIGSRVNELIDAYNDATIGYEQLKTAVESMEQQWENVKDTFPEQIQSSVNEYFNSETFKELLDETTAENVNANLPGMVSQATADIRSDMGELSNDMSSLEVRVDTLNTTVQGINSKVNAGVTPAPEVADALTDDLGLTWATLGDRLNGMTMRESAGGVFYFMPKILQGKRYDYEHMNTPNVTSGNVASTEWNPLPKSGITVVWDGDTFSTGGTQNFYNVLFAVLGEDGQYAPATNYPYYFNGDPDFNDSQLWGTYAYFPYMEGVYFSVTVGNYTQVGPGKLAIFASDLKQHVSTAPFGLIDCSFYYNGGTPLFAFTTEYGLTGASANFGNYRAFVIPFGMADFVSCDPEYSLNAIFYSYDAESKTRAYIGYAAATTNWPYAGRNIIDLRPYADIEGAAAIIISKTRGLTYPGTGTPQARKFSSAGIAHYHEMKEHVHVTWNKNACVVDSNQSHAGAVIDYNLRLLESAKWNMLRGVGDITTNGPTIGLFKQGEYFAGAQYAATGAYGTAGVCFPWRTYMDMTRNPNSWVYACDTGTDDANAGFPGLVCSSYAMFVTGHTHMESTYTLRFAENNQGVTTPFDYTNEDDIFNLKPGDILIKTDGTTGHCVVVTRVISYNGGIACVEFTDASNQGTRYYYFYYLGGRESRYSINAIPYSLFNWTSNTSVSLDKFTHKYRPNSVQPIDLGLNAGVDSFPAAESLPSRHMFFNLGDRSNCTASSPKQISYDSTITTIGVYRDGIQQEVWSVASMSPTTRNGYSVIDVTDRLTTAGVYTFLANNAGDPEITTCLCADKWPTVSIAGGNATVQYDAAVKDIYAEYVGDTYSPGIYFHNDGGSGSTSFPMTYDMAAHDTGMSGSIPLANIVTVYENDYGTYFSVVTASNTHGQCDVSTFVGIEWS